MSLMEVGLREHFTRQLVFRWLERHQPEHLQRFPQLCCFSFDYITLRLNMDGRFDRIELDFIMREFASFIEGRTVLDIGANIGNHTLTFAEKASRVVALEPHPLTFELLKLNSRNQRNVTALNIGASDVEASLEATVWPGNMGGNSIDSRREGEKVQFQVRRVDDLPGLMDVGLIKIDVEGHEERALKGMTRLLRDQAPLVLIEQNPDVIEDGTSPSVELLRSLGYRNFYSLEQQHPWRWKGKLLHIAEGLLSGIPESIVTLETLHRLERREYDYIVASTVPLNGAA